MKRNYAEWKEMAKARIARRAANKELVERNEVVLQAIARINRRLRSQGLSSTI